MSNEQKGDNLKNHSLNIQVHKTMDSGIQSPSKIPNSSSPKRAQLNDIIKGAAWDECLEKNDEIKEVINGLDDKLNLVLAKQEYEYLQGYNIYVKRKERELRELISKLNDKNSNNTLKDEKIQNLEKTIQSIQNEQIKSQKFKDDQAKKIKFWQNKANNMEQERNFLQKQCLEAKRQNKLLKMAIKRLQAQISSPIPSVLPEHDDAATFLTETKPLNIDIKPQTADGKEQYGYGISTMQGSKEETVAHTSWMGAQQSHFTNTTHNNLGFVNSVISNNKSTSRAKTRSPQSRYRHIPTENLKFGKFIDLIWKSKMNRDSQKVEIQLYVQALETNYTDTVRDLKEAIMREQQKQKKQNFERVADNCQKNELESLFVECIEEVRKDIMKRRLKNEIYNKKKFQQIDKNTDEAREFEQSLLKLAQLAKNRVKVNEFTSRDRGNLLDLFVNNERTLLKVYEILFPHRATPNAGNGVSQQMVMDSGAGIYGQNAVRALNGGLHNFQASITQANDQLLNMLGPLPEPNVDEQRYQTQGQPQISPNLPNIMGVNKQGDSTGNSNASSVKGERQAYTSESGTRLKQVTYTGPVNGMIVANNNFVQPNNALSGIQASHLGVYRHDSTNSIIQTQ